jgi:hypothetical protein
MNEEERILINEKIEGINYYCLTNYYIEVQKLKGQRELLDKTREIKLEEAYFLKKLLEDDEKNMESKK